MALTGVFRISGGISACLGSVTRLFAASQTLEALNVCSQAELGPSLANEGPSTLCHSDSRTSSTSAHRIVRHNLGENAQLLVTPEMHFGEGSRLALSFLQQHGSCRRYSNISSSKALRQEGLCKGSQGTSGGGRNDIRSPDSSRQGLVRQPSEAHAHLQTRQHASIKPPDVVYSGPKAPSAKRITLRTLRQKYLRNEPLTMVTAYDYPSAVHVDNAGVDILLVGDSVAMVVHGHDTTLPVTLDEMILHCKAVSRGSQRAFLVGDLPFGSYEASTEAAIRSAVRIMKEGTMDAVKMEGGGKARVAAAKATVEAGVAVMGHVGLMPQAISVLGGFRPQGQSGQSALRVMLEARALQDAGCFGVVLECVPAIVAKAITEALEIPTIGIGAGAHTSGQVLVYHDLLGMMQHPHYVKVTPKFCKQYASLGLVIQDALRQYTEDVTARAFPTGQYSPYTISVEEEKEFLAALRKEGQLQRAALAVEEDLDSRLSSAGGGDQAT
eukprot:jgi/Botrbrau1/18844/Bobra.177_2s0007.2